MGWMRYFCALALLVSMAGCTATQPREAPTSSAPIQEEAMDAQHAANTLVLTSPAFAEGGTIPRKYTCDGEDISPPLEWATPPPGVQSLALIMDDPDAPAGTWVHWVMFNMPGDLRSLPEAVPKTAKLADGSIQGRNSWGRNGYGGPCPPRGQHRYFFKLYALDTTLSLEPSAGKTDLLAAMQGHILAQGQLMGVYRR